MNELSVVVSVRNDELKLAKCLASVRWADEIIIVDNESTDKTREVARKYTKNVFIQKNNPMLNVNKNYGFSKASKNWILSLDSDEVVPEDLAKEMKAAIESPSDIAGYWIPRKNIIFGKWIRHGLWWPDKQLRLFRKGKGRFPCKHVHEKVEVEGRIGELAHPFIHYNYDSITQYIKKMDAIYTENEVQNLASNYQLAWYDALRFPVSDFVKVYFAQKGYKDGMHGLVLSILQAFYSFLVFAKLWEKHSFPEFDIDAGEFRQELARSRAEIKYWDLTAEIKNNPNPIKKIYLKFLRRYALRAR